MYRGTGGGFFAGWGENERERERERGVGLRDVLQFPISGILPKKPSMPWRSKYVSLLVREANTKNESQRNASPELYL